MAKRFSETDIWKKQRWFRKLKPEYKLAFFYIKDQCDHSGIWNIDCSDLVEDLGIENFDLGLFVNDCNTEFNKETGQKEKKTRIKILTTGYLWVTGFIQFQYENKEGLVNPSAAPVRTALQILMKHGVLKEALDNSYITLTEPLQDGYTTPKDKDRDKEKKKGGMGENKILQKAIKFSEDGEFAIFEDGSKQKLGKLQKVRMMHSDLKPEDVLSGVIV